MGRNSVTPWKIIESEIPVNRQIYKVSRHSVERFQWSWSDELFWVVTFILVKFLSKKLFKKGVIPRKKNWIKMSCGYAHLHIMSFITTQFHEILFSGSRGVALTRKTGLTDWWTDGLHDWLTDVSKTLYPPQLVALGINIL